MAEVYTGDQRGRAAGEASVHAAAVAGSLMKGCLRSTDTVQGNQRGTGSPFQNLGSPVAGTIEEGCPAKAVAFLRRTRAFQRAAHVRRKRGGSKHPASLGPSL